MAARTFTMHRLATDEGAVRSVIEAARAAPNGEIDAVERTIAAFEHEYGMSSAEALRRLEAGELQPTSKVEGWMMALRLRDHLADAKARAR